MNLREGDTVQPTAPGISEKGRRLGRQEELQEQSE